MPVCIVQSKTALKVRVSFIAHRIYSSELRILRIMAMTKSADLSLVLKSLDGMHMLVAALPHAAEGEPAERHSFQTEVFAMAKDALSRWQTSAAEEIVITIASHAEEEIKVNTLKEQARMIIAAEEEAVADVKAKTDALAAARSEIALASKQHSDVEVLKKQESTLFSQRKESRDSAVFISESMLNMLKSGGWEDSETQDEAIEAVMTFLTRIDAEPAMVAAVPGCFKLKPEARGEFDGVVEEGISTAIASHIERLTDDVAKSSRALDLVTAETLGLWAILDLDRESATIAECDLSSAEDSLTAASAKRVQAGKVVASQDKIVAIKGKMITSQKTTIQELTDTSEALERLCLGGYTVELLEADEKMGEPVVVEKMDVDTGVPCSMAVDLECISAEVLPVAMVA